MRTRKSRRGFSLLEMLIVLAIVAAMAAVALPAMSRALRAGEQRRIARKVSADFRFARTQAVSGASFTDGSGAGSRVARFAAIRIDSAKQYSVILDDNTNGADGETVLRVVTIPDDVAVDLIFSSTYYIYFTSQGTLEPGNNSVTVRNGPQVMVVRVNASGQVAIDAA